MGKSVSKEHMLLKREQSAILSEYNYLINIKGLLIIPAKLWEFLGEKFVIARGLGGYLFLFSHNI